MANAKSKRRRKFSFTVNQKKTVEWKQALADKLRQLVHQYDRLVVFKFINPRTDLIQDLRKKFKKSKFFMGKNKVLQIGFGRTEQEEVDSNLHLVAQEMVGQRGILFTNESVDHVLDFFNSHSVKVHSRPGNRAFRTVRLEAGVMDGFTHNQEPYLRKLGLVTRLKVAGGGTGTGVPELLVPYTVCTKGKRLKTHEATLLRLMGYKDANFSVRLYCTWDRNTQQFNKFVKRGSKMALKKTEGEDNDEDDEEDEEMTSDDNFGEDDDEEEVEEIDDVDMDV